jgi:ABC-type branched-subunit amino acid transport system substrate-binding protein
MAELKPSPQARQSILKLGGAFALSLFLAACQIVPAARPEGPAVPSAPPVVVAQEPQRRSVPQPQRQQTNRVAVLVPLTGPNSGVGTSIANAAKLALADARRDGLELQVYDTARGAQAAAERALAEGNRLFLGPLLAEDVRQIAPIARRAGVPVVSFSNDVTVAGNGVYVMGFNPGQSIDRVVRHARSQGLQRFAGLIPEGEYGERSTAALRRAVEAAGGRLVATQTYGRSPAELRSAAIRLNAQAPYDAVLIADNGQIAMSAAATIRSGPSSGARILGTELWKSETALANSPQMRGAWFASVSDTLFDQFRTRYRARYSTAPSRLASLGYDAVLLAVRLSAQWLPGQPFPEWGLRSPAGFDGVDGAYRFGPSGTSERQLDVIQVNAGGFSVVSPAEAGFR